MSLPCDFVEGHLANVTLCAFGVCVAVSNSEMVLSTLLKWLLLCVFIVDIHIHIDCVCACVFMYACLQRLEFNRECQPPTFETESLLTWSLLVKLSWLAREPQGVHLSLLSWWWVCRNVPPLPAFHVASGHQT